MAGDIPLFQRDANGLLQQVPTAQADTLRAQREFSHVNLIVDILFTDAEVQQRKDDAAQATAFAQAAQNADAADKQRRVDLQNKLTNLGLTTDDAAILLGA